MSSKLWTLLKRSSFGKSLAGLREDFNSFMSSERGRKACIYAIGASNLLVGLYFLFPLLYLLFTGNLSNDVDYIRFIYSLFFPLFVVYVDVALLGIGYTGHSPVSPWIFAYSFAPLYFMSIAMLFFHVGWGILKLKNWARVATIAASLIGVIFDLNSLLLLHSFHILQYWFLSEINLSLFTFSTLLFILAHAFIIWYLTRPYVRQAFEHKANASDKG